MKLGDTASVTRRFEAADVAALLGLAGAPAAALDRVPEPLIGGLFSYLLGVELPGFGTNYLKQSIDFAAPAPLGRDLTATVEITRLRPDKHLCDLATRLTGPDGAVFATGRALVYVEDVAGRGEP